jgi:hypothetical protein
MLKKTLFVVAAVAMLGTVAQAGDVSFKSHGFSWTKVYTPLEIEGVSIPVKMDIGYWIKIPNEQNLEIKMEQDSIYKYSGCTSMQVQCNFNLTLSCEITSRGVVGGKYSCSVSPANIDAPGGTTSVCAELKDADLGDQPGGTNNVTVADIKIFVIPR